MAEISVETYVLGTHAPTAVCNRVTAPMTAKDKEIADEIDDCHVDVTDAVLEDRGSNMLEVNEHDSA